MKYLLLFLIILIGIPGVVAQDVVVDAGDIPSGQQVVITYDVTVNDNLPEGLQFIINQGTVSGSNFDAVLSDDPQTSVAGDETLTNVGFTLPVTELPATGESPLLRTLLLSILIAGVIAIVFGFTLVWRHRN